MQRNLVLLLLTILFLGVVTAVGQAQIDPNSQSEEELIIVDYPLQRIIDGTYSESQGSVGTFALLTPLSLAAGEPADSCGDAPLLIVTPDENDGASANIGDATEEASDPVLACMWNNPHRDEGYRTVWYRLIAPVSGRVTISTFNSRYDTVVAIYSGTCDNLTTLHCSDDHNGFTSEATVTISEGETYYVEIADWQPSVAPDPVMQLSVLLQPVDSRWDLITSKPAAPAISRHAVVAQGENIYVIGGQTGVHDDEGVPAISNRLMRFNTSERRWENLQQIPGNGYSNTTAALVSARIYLPSGDYGTSVEYDGIHWMYDIALNSWFEVAPIPKEDLPDGATFAWASAVVPPANNKYYLTGGMSSTDPLAPTANVSAETYVYLPGNFPVDLGSWIKLNPMQAGRYAHTSGWIETNNLGICVAGGLGVGEDPDTEDPVTILHRSAECYQPGGNWSFIGDLNIPRFGAGSVVGPDGKWYVFGGTTVNGLGFTEVARTEVYDPILNTWSVLDPTYNLGTYQTMPSRSWPRGAMVGNELWVVGGSIFTENGEEALPTVDRLLIPSKTVQLPVVNADYDDALRPDDTFSQARQISFGGSQRRNFDQQRDFFDVYTFNVTGLRQVDIRLEVPENNNFDLELYGQNKLWRGGNNNSPKNGVDEHISLVLHQLRYYVVVKRVFPTGQPDKGAYYTLTLE